MNNLFNKDILTQFADFADFSNTINGGRIGAELKISEKGEYRHIQVIAPAVSPENMKVNIEDGMLVIAASLPFTRQVEENGEVYTKEANVPYFFRTINLPPYANLQNIQAVHEGKTLHIKVEYKGEGKRKWKNIPIRKFND
jgi:HSP20 family molecular chaperone IbpA